MLDVLIKNGTLIDGSGGPRYVADIGVRDARIVSIGQVSEHAERTIDASDLIIAPGFIDPHTHYDAAASWDPARP